jgi:hypothetical protein
LVLDTVDVSPRLSDAIDTARVYVAPAADDRSICLFVLYVTDASGTACTSVAFLGERGFYFLLRREGLPGPLTRIDIIGVANERVGAIRVDDAVKHATPNADGGFWLTLRAEDIKGGVPRAVAAYDRNDSRLSSLALPAP